MSREDEELALTTRTSGDGLSQVLSMSELGWIGKMKGGQAI